MSVKEINIKPVLLTLLFPVVSFILALRNPKESYFKPICVLFFTFLGIAFYNSGIEADISRYIADFQLAALRPNLSFYEFFLSHQESNQIDYYLIFITWLTSRFVSNTQIFTGLLAFVYAIFFALNINYIVSRCDLEKTGILLIILLIATPNVIFLTHRWWTALQVFIYGTLPIVFEKKHTSIVWCFISAILIHFSFIYPLIIIILIIFLPKKNLLPYYVVFIVCGLINSFDFDFIIPYIERLMPEQIADRTVNYINFEELEHNFFSQSARIFMNIANMILVTIIYIFGRHNIYNNLALKRLFIASTLFASFASITSITEWGWRYLDLSNLLIETFYLYYLSLNGYEKNINAVLTFIKVIFVYIIIFQTRNFLAIIGPLQLFLGNYLTTWFISDNFSMLDLIKIIIVGA